MSNNRLPLNIEPEMTVLDIISAHRQTEAVFRSYDAAAGECICCNALFETMQNVAHRYGWTWKTFRPTCDPRLVKLGEVVPWL